MKTRKSYITIQFFLVLALTFFVMFLPSSESFKDATATFIDLEWLKQSLSIVVSGSSLFLFFWLAPKTSILIEE